MASSLTREQYAKELNKFWKDAYRDHPSFDGVSLFSTSHPRAPWYRRLWFWLRRPKLSPDSLETMEIEIHDPQGRRLINEVFVSSQEIEKEIQAKGLTAPRVTLEQIEQTVVAESYITGDAIPVWVLYPREGMGDFRPRVIASMSCLTICVLVLKNGFTVTGKSACVSRENFNAELGRKIARQKAVEKIWALEGYLLKEKLHEAG